MPFESLSNVERQQKILQFLSREQRISVTDICKLFSVSEATARRDLDVLVEQNHLQRVHGGAILIKQAPPELPILERELDQAGEKDRIGLAAAKLVNDGETIFLGSGTTVLAVARALREHRQLTVITNSLPVLNMLSNLPEITLIALGGIFRPSELSFIGHITEQSIQELRADKVIIGVHAISQEHGLTNDYMPETLTDRAILQMGQQVIIVADHSKFGRVSTVYLAPVEKINTIVTDNQLDQSFVEFFEARNIAVLSV
ncbi:MAG TPA: DeoR/GlpR family DNA-binding transcription regulator [Anaerolineaceae bacterium]|nr:DeoR/GlpR family DNA-binding transcription regulator [Anaerolineaceae bacterium]